jgi:predicted CXXCH cytochrome family protein
MRNAVLLCASISFAVVTGAWAAAPPGEAELAKHACLDAGCHAALGQKPVVHGAIAGGDCVPCHEQVGKEHRFKPVADPISGVCTGCHDDPAADRPAAHAPVKDGACTTCHDPHSSSEKLLLIDKPAELCTSCHGDIGEALALAHPHPVAREPGCPLCHDPHGAKSPKLLREIGNALCLACHGGLEKAGAKKDGDAVVLFGSRRVEAAWFEKLPRIALNAEGRGHPFHRHAVGGVADPSKPDRPLGCLSCHDPHGSAKKALLLEGGGACGRCHKK